MVTTAAKAVRTGNKKWEKNGENWEKIGRNSDVFEKKNSMITITSVENKKNTIGTQEASGAQEAGKREEGELWGVREKKNKKNEENTKKSWVRGDREEEVRAVFYNVDGLMKKENYKRIVEMKEGNDFIGLVETKVRSDSVVFLEGYRVFRKERRNGKGGGVLLAVKYEFPSRQVSTEHDLEAVVVKVNKVLVGCVYLAPPVTLEKIRQLGAALQECTEKTGCRFALLGGDFNCRGKVFDDTERSSQTAEVLAEVMQSLGLGYCSPQEKGKAATYVEENGYASVLDLVFAEEGNCIVEVVKIRDERKKKHWPLAAKLCIPAQTFQAERGEKETARRGTIRKVSVEQFQRLLISMQEGWDPTLNTAQDLDKAAATFGQEIRILLSKVRQRQYRDPWFNDELCERKRQVRRTLARVRRNGSEENLREYAEAKQEFREEEQLALEAFWSEVAASARDAKACFKAMRKEKREGATVDLQTRILKAGSDIECIEPPDMCEAIATGLSASVRKVLRQLDVMSAQEVFGGVAEEAGSGDGVSESGDSESEEDYNRPFAMEEVEAAVKAFANGKAAGADEISHEVLRAGGAPLREMLLRLFERSWELRHVPAVWKLAIIKPFVKPNANMKQLRLTDLRPISLLPTMAKTLEKIVSDRLNAHLESIGYFKKFQSGFRRGHGTLESIANLVVYADEAVRARGDTVAVIFWDIQKAYDSVDISRLLGTLGKAGIRGRLLEWLASFLTHRRQKVSVSQLESEESTSEIGVAQGAILSPSLYAVFVNSFFDDSAFDKNEPGQNELQLHADDCSFAITIPNETAAETAADWLRVRIAAIRRWCISNRQLIAAEKTKGMLISKNEDRKRQLAAAFGDLELWQGVKLQFCDSFKFLGVFLQSDLSWTTQTAHNIKKANFGFARLRGAVENSGRNCDVATRRVLANAVVLTHLLNSALIWVDVDEVGAVPDAVPRVYRNTAWWVLNLS